MSAWFTFVGWNTLVAAVLASALLLAGRVWKRPELFHVLWIVLLVKLVTPGWIQWNALPALPALTVPPEPVTAAVPIVGADVGPIEIAPAFVPVAAPNAASWWTYAPPALWLVGSMAFLVLTTVRLRRFFVALRASEEPNPELRARIHAIAQRLGVALPRTLVVDAPVPPMVWRGPSGAMLVLPGRLLAELEPAETDAILAHELAHLKRGDPWVRWIELAVTTVLWWNPIVWWVRRNLRRAEEQACDRRVLEVLPESRRVYAEGIVKTVEFLAGQGRTPVLGTGATGTRHIRERLIMILEPGKTRRFRHPLIPALLVALLALPIVPGFADRDDVSGEEREKQERLIALEREALELERRLHEIQTMRAEVEREMERTRAEHESVAMERQVEELRRQGMRDEAADMEREIARMHERIAMENNQRHEMMDRERAMRDAELAYREAMIELERARHQRDGQAVKEYQRAVEMHQRALQEHAIQQERAHEAFAKAQQQYETASIKEKLAALQKHRQAMIEQGRYDEAEAIASEIAALEGGLAAQKQYLGALEKREKEFKGQRNDVVKAQAEILKHLSKLEMAMEGESDSARYAELAAQREELLLKLEQIEAQLEAELGEVR